MVSLAFFRFFYGSIISSGETEPLKNHARRFLWMGSAGVFAAQEAPTTRGCWRSASENPQAFGGMFPKRIGLEPSLAASDPQALIVDLPLETAMFITKAREVGERGSGRHSAVGGWPKRSMTIGLAGVSMPRYGASSRTRRPARAGSNSARWPGQSGPGSWLFLSAA